MRVRGIAIALVAVVATGMLAPSVAAASVRENGGAHCRVVGYTHTSKLVTSGWLATVRIRNRSDRRRIVRGRWRIGDRNRIVHLRRTLAPGERADDSHYIGRGEQHPRLHLLSCRAA